MPQNQKIFAILENSLIVLHGLILILVIGQDNIQLPAFLEVVGRMHPLLLHFPIVMLFLAALLFWFPDSLGVNSKVAMKWLLLSALFFTGITVLAGLFLSVEDGYVKEDFENHQWTGLLVFWIGTLWYLFWVKDKLAIAKGFSVVVLALVLATGHFGASLTHGEDFLFEPLQSQIDIPQASFEEALAYDHVIKPILQQKCISCHKAGKVKGELRMDEVQYILKGGEMGPAVDMEDLENSQILVHILIPLEEEFHMPPKGKPQLTDTELALIQNWILDSAHFDKKLTAYNSDSEFFALAKEKFASQDSKSYPFEAASAKTIAGLNNDYRKVMAKYPDSPGLRVTFFGKNQFDPSTIDDLKKVKEQVVELSFQNMPLKDEDLKQLSNFPNLEVLNLNFTGIEGNTLGELKNLQNLTNLSLSGNPLSEAAFESLEDFSQLKNLFVWTSKNTDAIASLKTQLPDTNIEGGFQDTGTLYQLNAPQIEYKKSIFTDKAEVTLKHPIGSVKIFYTLDNTLPDSSNHQVYSGPLSLDKNTTLRARAFADGWLGSTEKQAVFFSSKIQPDSYKLTFPPNESYKGSGALTLFDLDKGDEDFFTGKWLGFQDTPFEIQMDFKSPQSIQNIAFSTLAAEASHIFPPSKVEVWIKTQNADWKLVDTQKPEQPIGNRDRMLQMYESKINQNDVLAIKAKLTPVYPLPKWHQGAGGKGWVFVDEILIN
ncbi:chitobiase/beta-hexosaminidase C-terminal domain-containing protein [Aquiflexum sp. TKW24L]|uniref:chitobiase/beta-hexosaminidase C-terminal domain-containing protein n=1 Tax=Aquiflexum sp. TKW24L TaxID=2942212 RepID=UPI0020BE2856|nr:chitobiase/beta-hexosaminidase C-terminal domain-containing protein [Aquiflexum sp. TKW24L]MCL6261524.1 chitobiase/beta-hexosaminidase C-terminal domain-containing protein [Aquiflexum sp. TKW24L]